MIIKTEDTSLYLPRLLCLHGGGTNAPIFRAQCRVLERALKPFFRLCYAEAPFPAQPGPDVTSVYAKMGPFKAWINPSSDTTSKEIENALLDALQIDDDLGATGPVVGLLGFSQGARVSGSLLYARQLFNSRASFLGCRLPEFKFAILLAGRGPIISFLDRSCDGNCELGLACGVDCAEGMGKRREMLALPTLHVHGLQDPNLDLHRMFLAENCDPSKAAVMQWDGAHRVPIKTKDVAALVEQILLVAQHCQCIVEASQGRNAMALL